jgi:OmpA-OmpF porin, OOP family
MNQKCFKIALILCAFTTCCYAQGIPGKKSNLFSYSFSLSDYNFIKNAKDSSFSKALNQKDQFKTGNSSYGFGISYWQGLTSHIDFSGNLAGTFSNFPALFVKGDSIGQAGFSSQLDALLHFRAFKEDKIINPFLTAGIGAGYFGNQQAVYAPVGMGLQFQFTRGSFIFLQAQGRMALTGGISDDYMFYSLGFAHQANFKKETKQNKITAVTKAKKEKLTRAVADKDSDGDGVPDSKDKCPTEKGTLNGCPDADGDGIADVDDRCKDVAGLVRYQGCPVPDSDGDGVNDEEDKCKDEKGPKENFGCAWPDTDGDGVLDKDDVCPQVKGLAQYKGCPLAVADSAEIISVTENAITYFGNFEFSQATLLPQTFALLKNIVDILKADPSLHVQIDGHADNLGTDAGNMRVSAERAKIAYDYFRSYNIADHRLKYAWHGATQPIDPEHQWRNRRVEITIFRK